MPKHPVLEKEEDNSPVKIKKSSGEDNGLVMYALTFLCGMYVGRNMNK